LGYPKVLEVNEPVLIVRPDDGPIGLKHVVLTVLLMVIMDVLDGNINTLYKIHINSLKYSNESTNQTQQLITGLLFVV
jgi:hypothetical protein